MTLLEVRKRLVQISGDYGLVKTVDADAWVDDGANEYIRAGQRWLDDRLAVPAQDEKVTVAITQSDTHFHLDERVRFIERIDIQDTDNIFSMFKRDINYIRENYSDVDTEEGRPLDWIRAGLETHSVTSGTPPVTTTTYRDTINFYPPSDGTYTLNVFGARYKTLLDDDTDVSWWSENYPEVLIRAARMQIEMDRHRNASGVKGFADMLMLDLKAIDSNQVAERVSKRSTEEFRSGVSL